MIYFIYGEDSYRVKNKLEEMVSGYKKVHKSGLNLIYIDADGKGFEDFYGALKINSMFSEKKLIILKNVFDNTKFQEDFLENIKNLEETKDIIIVYEDNTPDKRTKFFKALQKTAKCQEFNYLQLAMLKKWVVQEFGRSNVEINPDALDLMAVYIGSDLWAMTNEINKLSNYRAGSVVKKEDVELLVKPNIENDMFQIIEALVSKDKRIGLSLLHKYLDDGEAPLKLLGMIVYQFRTLLIIKELQDKKEPFSTIAKKSGLHPFVVQKNYYLCNQFSIDQLKKIYQNIFQVDSDIKTGQIEPEIALDLLLTSI